MITITHDLSLKMSGTNRLICQEMLRRGWAVSIPYWYTSHFYIDKGDGIIMHIYSSSSPKSSFASALLSNDKYATSKVLEANGIFQLPMYLIDDEIGTEIEAFLNANTPIIVKPLDGSHGNGITANVTTKDQLPYAVTKARSKSYSGKVLLQKQLLGKDLKDVRVLVIDGKYVGAIHRIAARVFGDGIASVQELIIRENKQPHRGEPYKSKLATIDIEAAQTYLKDTIKYIPKKDEEVTVLGAANYGAGGELVDISDELPDWMISESVAIANSLELKVVGIDYMIQGEIAEAQSSGEQRATVIEVNKCPSLAIHDEPTVGQTRNAVVSYIDYLARL